MAPRPKHPLPDSLCDDCTCLAGGCAEALEWIEALGRAGLDVSRALEEVRGAKEFAEGIKRELFPHRP